METQRQVNQASDGNRAPRPYLRMEKFSEACVIASTHTILLVQNAFDAGYLSRRNPAVIYFLFAAALVVLANEFAGLYRVDSPDSCITNSITIMSYCAESDQQASRLVYILSSFRDVVAQQRARREKSQGSNFSLPSISSQLYGVYSSNSQTTVDSGQDGSMPKLHQVPIHIYPGMQTLPHSDPSAGQQSQQLGAPDLSVHLTPIQVSVLQCDLNKLTGVSCLGVSCAKTWKLSGTNLPLGPSSRHLIDFDVYFNGNLTYILCRIDKQWRPASTLIR